MNINIMKKFEIDESIKNSLTAVAKLLFSPDFRHPTSNSSFEFLFQYSAIDDRAIKVKLEEGSKFINGDYVYGIIISLEGIYPNSDPVSKKKMKSMEAFASFDKYLEHVSDFVEYIETILKFFDAQSN